MSISKYNVSLALLFYLTARTLFPSTGATVVVFESSTLCHSLNWNPPLLTI